MITLLVFWFLPITYHEQEIIYIDHCIVFEILYEICVEEYLNFDKISIACPSIFVLEDFRFVD